ncbi:MAG: S49 family peptidase [Anaerolineae bacterium]
MNRQNVLRVFLTIAALLLVLVAGLLLARYLIPTPEIAVIRIEGDIWGSYTAYVRQAMEEAANDPAIRAVVLEISSPGGEVTASEDMYFEVLRLRDSKPVVAAVNEMAASGAYYIASAADRIYAKPGSMVGNIGVISILPEPDQLDEIFFTTGPFKLSGGSQVEAIRQLEVLKDTFVTAILAQREDRLNVGPEILSRGEIYLGLQAEQMGLIDQVGSKGDAVEAAASLAKLRNYQVVDRTPELPEEEILFEYKMRQGMTAATVAATPNQLPPGFYFRYVEPLQ